MHGRRGLGRETGDQPTQAMIEACNDMRKTKTKNREWCGIPVIVDDATTELIHAPPPDEDPEQELVFRATQTTVQLVSEDFERYRSTLELMGKLARRERTDFAREGDRRSESNSDGVMVGPLFFRYLIRPSEYCQRWIAGRPMAYRIRL